MLTTIIHMTCWWSKKFGCGLSSTEKVQQLLTSVASTCKRCQMEINFFQLWNSLGAPTFGVSLNKNICYKIVSNFAPNKEGSCSIFPFFPNIFHLNSQWVPISNLSFFMKGSHNMVTKRVLVTIKGGKWRRDKKSRG